MSIWRSQKIVECWYHNYHFKKDKPIKLCKKNSLEALNHNIYLFENFFLAAVGFEPIPIQWKWPKLARVVIRH